MPETLKKLAGQLNKAVPHIMPSRYRTQYDPKRDPYYGLEQDPATGRVHDTR